MTTKNANERAWRRGGVRKPLPSSPALNIVVEQGSIHVNSIRVMLSTENVVWLLGDTRAKYPEVQGIGNDGDRLGVTLFAGERTLRAEKVERSTKIDLVGVGDGWTVVATAGRYSVSIVFVRGEENALDIAHWSDSLHVASRHPTRKKRNGGGR